MRTALLLAILAALPALAGGAEQDRWTLAVSIDGQALEGFPLLHSRQSVELLGRDGRLWSFSPDRARDFRKTSSSFASYSSGEIRGRLLRELGSAFDVTATGHYLVAHPKGQRDAWAGRFEEMYRSFFHYFSLRGFEPRQPEFPLVAIVWHSQQDFHRYAAAEGSPLGPGFLGYYSSRTNRITLYDQTAGQPAADWSHNAHTIIHEVTHQTAYNTGIHRRFADTPRWLAEGLASMFEAPGVWNSRQHRVLADRVNRSRLAEFRQQLAARPAGRVAELLASDRLFDIDASAAYAESWALTFYLAEKHPQKYSRLLALTASKPLFEVYSSTERLSDFAGIFGDNLRLLESQLLKFIASLP